MVPCKARLPASPHGGFTLLPAPCSSPPGPGCSTFRDFPAEHLLPVEEGAGGGGASGSSGGAAAEYRLNPWQVRHATLVVQALKEVNELRFVLCPK